MTEMFAQWGDAELVSFWMGVGGQQRHLSETQCLHLSDGDSAVHSTGLLPGLRETTEEKLRLQGFAEKGV